MQLASFCATLHLEGTEEMNHLFPANQESIILAKVNHFSAQSLDLDASVEQEDLEILML